ncbi:MAG: hypothetical protein A2W99_16065 [Bacteroidetes bacterium GWF2_33_16]|nr:MAG: hypothetical protein A2X00_15410 [Bacteroidetes bacterium GWE2_32_14]OFY02417.1 MAG: hypothetical protein A2W99_16065 [Bacteroidetes bacterium GWF2_33_16]
METLQNLIDKYFKVDENTSATIIITISIFLIGISIQFISNQIKKYFIKKVRRKTFIEIVRNLSKTTKKQSDKFVKTSESLSIESLGKFYLTRNVLGHIDSFREFNFVQVYESFLYRINFKFINRRKLISKIYEHVKLTTVIDAKCNRDIEKLFDKLNHLERGYLDSVDSLRKKFIELSDNIRYNGIKGLKKDYVEYIIAMDRVFANWSVLEDRGNIYISYNNLTSPLLKVNSDFVDCNRELLDFLFAADNYYKRIIRLLDTYSKLFMDYASCYKCSTKVLTLCINKI